jgi:hypothetical protein
MYAHTLELLDSVLYLSIIIITFFFFLVLEHLARKFYGVYIIKAKIIIIIMTT